MFNSNKLRITIPTIAVLVLMQVTTLFAQTANIDTSQLDNGVVNISYQSPQNKKTKVLVSMGTEKYTYDLKANGQYPLQFGDGTYTVSILENAMDNQYKVVKSEQVNLKKSDANAVYLQSIDMINWNSQMKAIQKAKEITKDAKTDQEKAAIIYDYITNSIKYDNDKAVSVNVGYIPSIDQTLDSKLGICFDYSVLNAAMLRSVNVPTKLVMGRNKDINEYHAWNEVYLQETNEWVVIDTTYDASAVQQGSTPSMIKNSANYTVEKQY